LLVAEELHEFALVTSRLQLVEERSELLVSDLTRKIYIVCWPKRAIGSESWKESGT
jgi:hypothetical protein